MAKNEFQRRIARAEELGAQYSSAAEILRFYAAVARFQERFYAELGQALARSSAGVDVESGPDAFARPFPSELAGRFNELIDVVESSGPDPLREAARELRSAGESMHLELLTIFWNGGETESPQPVRKIFSHAPFAAVCGRHSCQVNFALERPGAVSVSALPAETGLGILRPLGEGGQRSLLCSFCLAEWEFRRIVCPGCGEENHAKLPVYTAEQLKHVRVEACDSCRTYIKTVDMTTNGRAEPIVDEMAAIPLDLWRTSRDTQSCNPTCCSFDRTAYAFPSESF